MYNSNTMTDKNMDECIKKIANGDMTALKRLYDVLRVPIYKFALSIVKSPMLAEDIAQETFLRIMANIQVYRPKGKPRAWIFSIVHNLAISELRKKTKFVDIEEAYNLSDTSVDFSVSEGLVLLDSLNPDEKEIVCLHILADLKHYDIAKILNMPYEQVRWKYAYSLKKLKKYLTKTKQGEGFEYENEKS